MLMQNKNSRDILKEVLGIEFLNIEDTYDQIELANIIGVKLQPLKAIVKRLQQEYDEQTLNNKPHLVNYIWDTAVSEAYIRNKRGY